MSLRMAAKDVVVVGGGGGEGVGAALYDILRIQKSSSQGGSKSAAMSAKDLGCWQRGDG